VPRDRGPRGIWLQRHDIDLIGECIDSIGAWLDVGSLHRLRRRTRSRRAVSRAPAACADSTRIEIRGASIAPRLAADISAVASRIDADHPNGIIETSELAARMALAGIVRPAGVAIAVLIARDVSRAGLPTASTSRRNAERKARLHLRRLC
jgi:hypothetical protein